MKSKTAEFVRFVAHRDSRAMFGLPPPQRAAHLERGLLDPGKAAVGVDLSTSAGKTLLVQFRMLQVPSQFDADEGVAFHNPSSCQFHTGPAGCYRKKERIWNSQ